MTEKISTPLDFKGSGRSTASFCNVETRHEVNLGEDRVGIGEPIAAYGVRLIDKYERQLRIGFGVPDDSARANGNQLREELDRCMNDPKKNPNRFIGRLEYLTGVLKEGRSQNVRRGVGKESVVINPEPVVVFSGS